MGRGSLRKVDRARRWLGLAALVFCGSAALGCTNNPYPSADDGKKIAYLPYETVPKNLDPAVGYATVDSRITSKTLGTLLEYHYLERPYRLIPSMAKEVPSPEELEDGRVRYTFKIRPHIRFEPDECFELSLGEQGVKEGRATTAQDFAFELYRVADPGVGSPVISTFSVIEGFAEFGQGLKDKREKDPAFAELRIDKQYAQAGGVKGISVPDAETLVITLKEPYPQLLYWFAMAFTTPVAWESVEYYDGKEGREPLSEHPVATGPYVLSIYEKQSRMILTRNPNWWGLKNPDAPGAVFPKVPEGKEWDDLRPAVGKQLPFLDRIEYRMDKESIPRFNKYLQGYYDRSGINKESFNKVVQQGGLSEEMKKKGVRLQKDVEPAVYYLGFNMNDPVVGRDGADRSRALRQAMSLAIDSNEYLRLFRNGRGIAAQSPIPPGIFGYDKDYKNEFRQYNLEKAKKILKDAGLAGGIDPETGKPLQLSFDVGDTSASARSQYMFYIGQWRRLGLDVKLNATNYNQFYAKMKKGSFQIYTWGWMADYPDPENFLFLLLGKFARSVSGGSNYANFQNAEYDALFEQMRNRDNDEVRYQTIRKMVELLERESPWINIFHPRTYELNHSWLKNARSTPLTTINNTKYHDVDAERRAQQRATWNQPIIWPVFVGLFLLVLILVPGIRTYYRERV